MIDAEIIIASYFVRNVRTYLFLAGVLSPIRGIGLPPIIGGTEASIEDAPWQVALQHRGEIHCGGSIITPLVILTAAQCTLS